MMSFIIGRAPAQNLVQNPSFEDYTLCPTNLSQVERAVGWSDVSQSPDYFNRCNTNDSMDVPLNVVGYQEAFDGDAYVGMGTYVQGVPTYRECVQSQLSAPLVPGVPVYLSMMISPGGFGNDPNNNSIRFASSGIGMKFSMAPHATTDVWPGNVAVHLGNVLSDTANWIQLSAIYVPDSSYSFVILGCFFPDSQLSIMELDPTGQVAGAYAFVDAVCVSDDPSDCPFTSAIEEVILPWALVNNPVGDELFLRLPKPLAHGTDLWIVDAAGRQYRTTVIEAGATVVTVAFSDIPAGVYFLVQSSSIGGTRPIKIVHVKP